MTQAFMVDTPRLRAVADRMDDRSLDVSAVDTRLELACRDRNDDGFGEYGVAAAYNRFLDLWRTEVGLCAVALHELGKGMRTAADGYDGADAAAAGRLGG